MNYETAKVPNPTGLPERFNTELRFVKLERGHPIYTFERPNKSLLEDFEVYLREEMGMPKEHVSAAMDKLANVAMVAAPVEIDGDMVPAVLCPNDLELLPEIVEHELIHCDQMVSGRLSQGIEEGQPILLWEGQGFSQNHLIAIQQWGEESAGLLGWEEDKAYCIAQMILPWEAEAYETTRHLHPEMSAVADNLRKVCPYLVNGLPCLRGLSELY